MSRASKRGGVPVVLFLSLAACSAVAWRGGSRPATPPLALTTSSLVAPAPASRLRAPAVTPERLRASAQPEPAPKAKLNDDQGELRLRGRFSLASLRVDDAGTFVPLDDGGHARLSLDAALQARADELVRMTQAPSAAIVLMEPTGRLLAVTGASTIDPSLQHELAVTTWAPAASIFKLVTATALVQAGLDAETVVCHHGGSRAIDEAELDDDPRLDHECSSLGFAVGKSQNVVLAKLTDRHLDLPALMRAATALGFGEAPAFALAADPSTADLPTDRLELARAAAGFWRTELSPLGGAVLAATIASGGLRPTPHVVDVVVDGGGRAVPTAPSAPARTLDPAVAQAVGQMMIHTTTDGTAAHLFRHRAGSALDGFDVAGKTGSLSRRSTPSLHYSWFVGFAPAQAPRYVVSVLVANTDSGRYKAGHLARLLLEAALAR